ncbi:MAG: zinc-ribbon domain-containing protein [Pararhodobacter sp.]|nr:zinc-ribbon domain-containing protein [Pararhodobacter sp.]
MRLTCPNCKAQYEVEESVIPEGGRDVQCSSCGHTWYQYPIDVALQMRAAELDDDDDDDPAAAATSPTPARQIDRTVMDLLREEADRELRERRQAAGTVESQPDLGLPVRPSRPNAPAGGRSVAGATTAPEGRRRGNAEAQAVPGVDAATGLAAEAAARSRLEQLPDIEELSSTLEPRREPRKPAARTESGAAEETVEERRGLVRGLSMVVIIVGVLLFLYLFAPLIVTRVPILETAMTGYVAMIDALRLTIAQWVGNLRGLVGI